MQVHSTTDGESALKAAAQMPLLHHYVHGRRFDIMQSDVAAWLCDQPEIRQFVFNFCKRHGAVVWDNGNWRGAKS